MTTDIETARDTTRDNRDDEHWVVKASRFVAEPMVRVTQDLAFGDHPRLRYDLYEPPPSTKAVATAHFIYGGSWETGERGCYRHVGAGLAMQAIRTVIADYRLHPEVSFPGFVDDMAQAYAHVAQNHGTGSAPPVIIGHSAGAHIGALLCGDRSYFARAGAAELKPSAFVGMSGPYVFDPTTWDTTKHIFTPVAETPDRARPIVFASRDFPPTLLIHGGRDTLVTPNASEIMHNALLAAGASSDLKIYPHLAHAGPIAVIARPMRWLAPVLKSVSRFVIAESKKAASAS
jgi:acetyl esterase/lipase